MERLPIGSEQVSIPIEAAPLTTGTSAMFCSADSGRGTGHFGLPFVYRRNPVFAMSDRYRSTSWSCRYRRSRLRFPTIISSPLRLWLSFLWTLRCSVKWLIRSVSSATWTSGEPVSVACLPNDSTTDWLSFTRVFPSRGRSGRTPRREPSRERCFIDGEWHRSFLCQSCHTRHIPRLQVAPSSSTLAPSSTHAARASRISGLMSASIKMSFKLMSSPCTPWCCR